MLESQKKSKDSKTKNACMEKKDRMYFNSIYESAPENTDTESPQHPKDAKEKEFFPFLSAGCRLLLKSYKFHFPL